MGQIAFAISSVPEIPITQVFDVKQHSMKKAQEKSLGTLQLIMMRCTVHFFCKIIAGFQHFFQVPLQRSSSLWTQFVWCCSRSSGHRSSHCCASNCCACNSSIRATVSSIFEAHLIRFWVCVMFISCHCHILIDTSKFYVASTSKFK
jgi:hypothetical protein